jgi:hypothetical protein
MVAPEPPRRRCFARIRRSLRLPSQMNGVGIAFQPATASSNQVITSFAVFGCCPRKARSQMMRCIDSAIFSHDPLIGGVQRHDPMCEQPGNHVGAQVSGQVVPDQQHSEWWQWQVGDVSQPRRPVPWGWCLGVADRYLREFIQDVQQFILQPGM